MVVLWLAASREGRAAMTSKELFASSNVWTIHLTFTRQQWQALEPKRTGTERIPSGPAPLWLGREGERNGLSTVSGIKFEYVKANLEFGTEKLTNVAVRYKGNGTFVFSRNDPKHSLKIDLNKFVKGQKLAGVSKLNLHNNVMDASWMNETLSYQLFQDAGIPAPRTTYARVFVTVPGPTPRKFLGLYSLVENIDGNFAEKHFGAKTGALLKPVTRDLFKDLGTNWATYKQSYDAKTDLTVAQKQRVFDFARLMTTADDTEFAARVDEFLDMDEFARFMAVTVYLSALDSILSLGQNFLLYLDPKSNKFQFIPWDLDNSFGTFYMVGTQEERNHLSISQPWQGTNRFLARVFKVEAFQKIYRARLAEFSRTLFQPERFTNQVNAVAAAIRPAVKEESEKSNESPEKLTRFDKLVAGEGVEHAGPGGLGPKGIRGGNPRSFGTIEPIKSFVALRAQSIADQLAGKSEGKIINGNSE